MVYRIGEKVRSRPPKALASGAFLLAVLLISTIAVTRTSPDANPVAKRNKHLSTLSARKSSSARGTTSTKPGDGVSAPASLRTATCASLFPPKHPNLTNASSPELIKLAQYEQACDGAVVDRSSFFVPTPTSASEARDDAADIIAKLKEYSQMGIKPLVFLEPTTASGNIDLKLYQVGAYDEALNSYFAAIKAGGISDAMMGTWVIMPEANIPAWSSVDPSAFAANVTKTIGFQKQYFPGSRSSIMLDSQTYPSTQSWGNGSYRSLLPYVQGIPKGLVDSFGLQGFPWASPANQSSDKLYDPTVYLQTRFAAEAANSLGVHDIWLNTGTFSRMYTRSPVQTVIAQPAERQVMLDGVLTQAKGLQSQGFNVSVHLFAEDKSNGSEAVDWSYWQTAPGNDANTAVLATFAHDTATAHIPLWLYDSSEH